MVFICKMEQAVVDGLLLDLSVLGKLFVFSGCWDRLKNILNNCFKFLLPPKTRIQDDLGPEPLALGAPCESADKVEYRNVSQFCAHWVHLEATGFKTVGGRN